MITLINYNKGAIVTATRNTQIIAALYSFLCPTILHFLNDRLFHISEYIIVYISIIMISTGILVYILSVVILGITLLSFKEPYKKLGS